MSASKLIQRIQAMTAREGFTLWIASIVLMIVFEGVARHWHSPILGLSAALWREVMHRTGNALPILAVTIPAVVWAVSLGKPQKP